MDVGINEVGISGHPQNYADKRLTWKNPLITIDHESRTRHTIVSPEPHVTRKAAIKLARHAIEEA